MWCRPEPSSVSPIYMPGRLRTASRPFSTLMESAPYSSPLSGGLGGNVIGRSYLPRKRAGVDEEDVRAVAETVEQRKVGACHPGLCAECEDFLEQRLAPVE